MDYIPTMKTTGDKAKVIAAFILLIASVVFKSEYQGSNDELFTALSVLIAYIIGLYSETYNKKEDKQDE